MTIPVAMPPEMAFLTSHFHQRREQAAFYFGLRGNGLPVLQDEAGKARLEKVFTGSVHHIPSFVAYRLVNTGNDILSALAT